MHISVFLILGLTVDTVTSYLDKQTEPLRSDALAQGHAAHLSIILLGDQRQIAFFSVWPSLLSLIQYQVHSRLSTHVFEMSALANVILNFKLYMQAIFLNLWSICFISCDFILFCSSLNFHEPF